MPTNHHCRLLSLDTSKQWHDFLLYRVLVQDRHIRAFGLGRLDYSGEPITLICVLLFHATPAKRLEGLQTSNFDTHTARFRKY